MIIQSLYHYPQRNLLLYGGTGGAIKVLDAQDLHIV